MYLCLEGLCKSFGDRQVVKEMSLQVPKGKLVCLLGSSGCGKTTTLKMIGGFLRPDSGRVLVDGQDITALPPERRPVSTVFQSYALFPHMTVLENVIYGLKYRGVRRKEARAMGMAYLAAVDMADRAGAAIGEISGGQQQRVALVRSLITKPKVLLLDEPLSNLDAGLRVKMREEIRQMQRQSDITMVFVTHDQEEAMVLGDTIAIMDQGRLVQQGPPEQVYVHPESDYVRRFLGLTNEFSDGSGRRVTCRPEDLEFSPDGPFRGRIERGEFLGFYRQYTVALADGQRLTVRTDRREDHADGEPVTLCLREQ